MLHQIEKGKVCDTDAKQNSRDTLSQKMGISYKVGKKSGKVQDETEIDPSHIVSRWKCFWILFFGSARCENKEGVCEV